MNEKLTAYALNELPPDERAALEALMKDDPELRAEAEEMKAFCEMLGKEIHAGADDTLKPEQRTRLVQTFQSTSMERKVVRPLWRTPAALRSLGLAAAACVALMFALHEMKEPSPGNLSSTKNRQDVAATETKDLLLRTAPDAPKSSRSESVQVHPPAPAQTELKKAVSAPSVAEAKPQPAKMVERPFPKPSLQPAASPSPPAPATPPVVASASPLRRSGNMTLHDGQNSLSVAKDAQVDKVAPVPQAVSSPQGGAGGLTLSGGVTTYAGVTTTSGGTLTKSGNGAFNLSGNNTFTGTTTLSTDSGTIAGTGGVVLSGAGVLTMTGANSYSGGTVVNTGTLQISPVGSLGSSNLSPDAPQPSALADVGGKADAITGKTEFASGYAINGGSLVSAPSSTSPATIIKSGAGTLQFGSTTLDLNGRTAVEGSLSGAAGPGILTAGGTVTGTPVAPQPFDGLIASTTSGKETLGNISTGSGTTNQPSLAFSGGVLIANGTLTPAQATTVDDFTKAEQQFEDSLHIDYRGNAFGGVIAPPGQERTRFGDAARDHQRSKMLNAVNAGWEDQVPVKFDTIVPPSIGAGSTTLASSTSTIAGGWATTQPTPTFGLGHVEEKSTSTYGFMDYATPAWATTSGVSVKPDEAQLGGGLLPLPGSERPASDIRAFMGAPVPSEPALVVTSVGGTAVNISAATLSPAPPAVVTAAPSSRLPLNGGGMLGVDSSSSSPSFTTVSGVIAGNPVPQTPPILIAGNSVPSVTVTRNVTRFSGDVTVGGAGVIVTGGTPVELQVNETPAPMTEFVTVNPVVKAKQAQVSDPSGHASLVAQADESKSSRAKKEKTAAPSPDADFDSYKKMLDRTAELKKEAEALPENTEERTTKDNELRGKYRELREYENKLNELRRTEEHRRQFAVEQERLRLLRQQAQERMRLEAEERARQQQAASTATYRPIVENPFTFAVRQPLSTFSVDVDTASYSNVRRFLNSGQRPPADAVRLEEMINYFPYSYAPPKDDKPFSVKVDLGEAPWQPLHRLARIAIKAREVKSEERQAANFTFLLDVSGSMSPTERLPLVKQALHLLVEQLREDDRVSIVTYAGESGLALDSTPGDQKEKILEAIENLRAGGSTNGAGGIRLAYEQAVSHFKKSGINRVILCTDGDFNVGTSNVHELERLIAEKAKTGVFLSVLGVGTDNLHDHTMQTLADRGNGNYHYLDSMSEARKVLVEQLTGTLVTVAKDVKIQIEFNPAQVAAYRLIGYEKRLLAKEDFNNDKKDAGDIGAGHTITALYEIVPASLKYPDGNPVVDELKYNKPAEVAAAPAAPEGAAAAAAPAVETRAPGSKESMTVKLRYKEPNEDKSKLIQIPVTDAQKKLGDNDHDFQFAVSLAEFGMMLRNSPYGSELTWDSVRELALAGKGKDEQGWRGEYLQLIEKARGICGDLR